MIRNILKISFRNIWKNKTLTLINVFGLSIGISSAFVIAFIVFHETSFNKKIEDADKIYRIVTKTVTSNGEYFNRGVPVPLGNMFSQMSPEKEGSTNFFLVNQNRVENKSTNLVFDYPDKIIFADQSFFEIFKYNWLAGNSKNSLSNPNEVVLTIDRANKYFPDLSPESIIGNVLYYNDSIPVKIVGVVSQLKKPTDIYFQEFISTKSSISFGQDYLVKHDDWFNASSHVQLFVKIKDDNNIDRLSENLHTISAEHSNLEEKAIGQGNNFLIRPFSNLHFDSDYGIFDGSEHQGSKITLIGLSFIALFLVVLSTINFINLNTAQGLRRSKEIGIRKSLGSSRKQLIFQFLGEALLLNILATFLSILFALILLRIFSDFLPSTLDYDVLVSPQFLIFGILSIIALTLISGLYPAFVLSNYNPGLALRGKWNVGKDKAVFRKSLSVFQFAIAQLFIILTMIAAKQIYFLINKDIGLKTESIINLQMGNLINSENYSGFLEELRNTVGIDLVSRDTGTPFQAMMAFPMSYKDKYKEISTNAITLVGDRKYQNLFEIKLLAGRERLNDTIDEYIINETFSRFLGFSDPHNAIGNLLYLKSEKKSVPIVGVMEDFYTAPLHYKIEPTVLTGGPIKSYRSLNLSLEGTSATWPETLGRIRNLWEQQFPEKTFDARFVDNTLQNFYWQEVRISFLLKWATGLAILISLIGLWSLTIYLLETKKKEIGIRKLLGASLYQLNVLLSKEIILLIGVGFIIAVPFSYFISKFWLDTFAYSMSINWWVFALGGLLMLLTAFGVIGFKIFISAQARPIDSLKME